MPYSHQVKRFFRIGNWQEKVELAGVSSHVFQMIEASVLDSVLISVETVGIKNCLTSKENRTLSLVDIREAPSKLFSAR